MEITTPATVDDPNALGDLYSAECECRDILDLVASKWSALIIIDRRTLVVVLVR